MRTCKDCKEEFTPSKGASATVCRVCTNASQVARVARLGAARDHSVNPMTMSWVRIGDKAA